MRLSITRVVNLSSGFIGRAESKSRSRIAKRLKPNFREGTPQNQLQGLELRRKGTPMGDESLAVSQKPKPVFHQEDPLKVREAAKFLGVSPQTVYLWVERKQIPHLRVMGRNIRFLKSDLEPFRASFKQEMENG